MHDGTPRESVHGTFRSFRPAPKGPKIEGPMATLHSRIGNPQPSSRALASGLVLGLALVAGPSWAGDPAPARAAGEASERVYPKVTFAGAERDTLPHAWRGPR